MTEKLAIWTLGLEEDIWAGIGESEKSRYKWVGNCYVLLSVLSCSASFTLMWLITSSIVATIPSGLMLSFIICNMIRFSLITVRRSLYNWTSETLIIPQPTEKKGFNILILLKKFLKYLKPDLSSVIRTGVMLVMLQLIVFPNTVLLIWSSVSAYNEVKRAELISLFTKRNTNRIKTDMDKNSRQMRLINEAIDTLIENPGEVNLLLRKKQDERQRLLAENEALTRQLDSVYTVLTPQYSATIQKVYFPVLTFVKVRKTSLFMLMEFALLCLMFYPFLQLRRLKNGQEFIYSLNSSAYYRAKVLEDYTQNLAVIQKSLRKYGIPSEYQSIWSDPPFCTRYKQTVTPKVLEPLSNLLIIENQSPA